MWGLFSLAICSLIHTILYVLWHKFTMNYLQIIRKKLDAIGDVFIEKELLQQVLLKFAPKYTIEDVSSKGLITTLKRGKWYINNRSKQRQNPYKTISLYFWDDLYMFWGLGVYQRYDFSTQVIERYTVYNTKISGTRKIGKAKYIFKKARKNFFYWMTTAKSWTTMYNIMSRERAFMQLLKEWSTFTRLPDGINSTKLKKLANTYASKKLYQQVLSLCISKK